MMAPKTIQAIPEKTARLLAARAKRLDGCVEVKDRGGNVVAWEFPQNSMVVCLIRLDPPMGHMGKDARRAAAIRAELLDRPTDIATLRGQVA